MPKKEIVKFTTYLPRRTVKALKHFAVEREVNLMQVVDVALVKALPGKYFDPKESQD